MPEVSSLSVCVSAGELALPQGSGSARVGGFHGQVPAGGWARLRLCPWSGGGGEDGE